MTTSFYSGMVVARKKLGIIEHMGIVVLEGFQAFVIHNAPERGVIKETIETFSNGSAIEIVNRYRSPLLTHEIISNAYRSLGRQWNLFYNCQHFVTEALGLKKASYQLQLAVGICLTFLLLKK